MSSKKESNARTLSAVNEGVEKANRRAAGDFAGLFGSLPPGASMLLSDILVYLREYLLDERGLTDAHARKLAEKDEGVRVALGVLNFMASALCVKQIRLEKKLFGRDETLSLLLSGRVGLKQYEYIKRQRLNASKGARVISENRQHKEGKWIELARELRRKHPGWSNLRLASDVACKTKESKNTIRQALPRLGLSKKADK